MKVAIVGAGGLVGRRILSALEESKLPVSALVLTGHSRSVGKTMRFRGGEHPVVKTDVELLRRVDAVLLATPTEVSRDIVTRLGGGPLVIDTSSAFRLDEGVPLVVPEVNGPAIRHHHGVIAGPNCSTIQMVMVLHPLQQKYGLRRVVVTTYQSVSGAGYAAMRQLENEVRVWLASGKPVFAPLGEAFAYPIAFNVIPHIDAFTADGYTKEEMKMVLETRKILGLPDLPISATAVRVPVFVGHSESILVETDLTPDADEARNVLGSSPGIVVWDDPGTKTYPLPVMVEGKTQVFVGRVRRDLSSPRGLLLWVVADNLVRGAAVNAVGILETAYNMGLVQG
ncbi:MAG TPA: aspartate-semialdehyde dehydrogenase [Firmicutes bacterium]|nr:aspartate-semialdehyde dehydrogenase [Candidatus Fermentithermobacillaceae bacterium]